LLEVFKLKGCDLSQSSAEVYKRKFKVVEVVSKSNQSALHRGIGRQSQRKIAPALEENEPSASRCDPFIAEYPMERRPGGISEPAVRVGKAKIFCLSR
jgi:hypothetical protein